MLGGCVGKPTPEAVHLTVTTTPARVPLRLVVSLPHVVGVRPPWPSRVSRVLFLLSVLVLQYCGWGSQRVVGRIFRWLSSRFPIPRWLPWKYRVAVPVWRSRYSVYVLAVPRSLLRPQHRLFFTWVPSLTPVMWVCREARSADATELLEPVELRATVPVEDPCRTSWTCGDASPWCWAG